MTDEEAQALLAEMDNIPIQTSAADKDDLCRRGELPCPNCDKPMTMYYNPRCFHCTMPPRKTTFIVELIPALYYIENQGHSEFKNSFLDQLESLTGYEGTPESYLNISSIPDFDRSTHEFETLVVYDIFKLYYPDLDEILWHISW